MTGKNRYEGEKEQDRVRNDGNDEADGGRGIKKMWRERGSVKSEGIWLSR